MIWFLIIPGVSFICGCVAGGCWVSTTKPEHRIRKTIRAAGVGIGGVLILAAIIVFMGLVAVPSVLKLVDVAGGWWFGK